MATRPQANQLQTKALAFIGVALWVGVLLFGAVAVFVHARGDFPIKPQPMALRYAQMALSVVAVGVALGRRGRIGGVPRGPERNTQILQLWAVGEGAALFGGVLFLLTKEVQWFGLGLLSMLATFILVPVRRAE